MSKGFFSVLFSIQENLFIAHTPTENENHTHQLIESIDTNQFWPFLLQVIHLSRFIYLSFNMEYFVIRMDDEKK